MKALSLKKFNEMEVIDLEVPVPGPKEVLLEVRFTGICGSDVHGYTGDNGRRVPGQVMGHESSAVVAGLGERVSGLSIGQHVTFNPVVIPDTDDEIYVNREQMSPNKSVIGVDTKVISSFAQLICVPAKNIVPLPQEMPLFLGALIEPLAVAVHAVRRSGAKEDDSVLVLGGGPIGQSVALALQMHGVSKIVVSELQPSRQQLIKNLGFESLSPLDSDFKEKLELTMGGLADVVIDAVGITSTIQSAFEYSKIGANICLVGMGNPELTLQAFNISTEERTLIGSFTYSKKDFEDAAAWIGTVPPNIENLVSEIVTMQESDDAFSRLAQGQDIAGKILVNLSE